MDEKYFAHMSFVGRREETTQPKQEDKKISREEFRHATHEAAEKLIADPKIEGFAKMMIPLMGTVFACTMEEILFGKES